MQGTCLRAGVSTMNETKWRCQVINSQQTTVKWSCGAGVDVGKHKAGQKGQQVQRPCGKNKLGAEASVAGVGGGSK